jgi:PII-like signaling protein
VKIETDAKLVTVYVNSSDQWHAEPLYVAIVEVCRKRGIAGVTVARAIEGYGSSGRLHTARLLELSENLPVRIEIIDLPDRIEPLLPVLDSMIGQGLVTVSDVHVYRYLPDPGGRHSKHGT